MAALALLMGLTGLFSAAPAGASQSRPEPVARAAASGTHGLASSQPRRHPQLWRPGRPGHDEWRSGGFVRGQGLPADRPGDTAGRGWKVQPTPNGPLANAFLNADSCSGSTGCTAVGNYRNRAGVFVTLAERWNGATWALQPTPNPAGAGRSFLDGVSCTSANACTAAGYYTNSTGTTLTLAERWNGTTWAVQATPNPAGALASGLFAVSCTSASACTAAGDYTNNLGKALPLTERWNGTSWVIQTTPHPASAPASGLFGVSCASASACTAVGDYTTSTGVTGTFAESWGGTGWKLHKTPDPAGASESLFEGVSCTSAGACTAAGYYTSSTGNTLPLAERWNGTSWAIQATGGAAGSQFSAVSCTSARACTAVGASDGPVLAERWNGTKWAAQVTHGPTDSGLLGVSCVSARSCAAAGYQRISTPDGSYDAALGESWNGTTWRVRATPNPTGGTLTSNLLAVSCTSARACTAAGYSSPPAKSPPLAVRWNGTRWARQRADKPGGGSAAEFAGVSCPSARACTGVGDYIDSSGAELTLAEAWNGGTWSIQQTPNPAATGSLLRAVSCSSAGACTAVGNYFNSSGNVMLAERWNGSTWTIQHLAKPSGATGSQLLGVSCVSADACTAVGFYDNSSGSSATLAETWNGSTWSIKSTPNPSGAGAYQLTGLSCTSASVCTAVGSYYNSTGIQVTLAETWDGSTWSVHPTPDVAGAGATYFNGVSCTSKTACAAVGSYYDVGAQGPLPPLSVAAAWNGAAWKLQTTPFPPGTVSNVLTGVSCTSAGCTATGYHVGLSGAQVTLAMARSSP